jgi:hypothetical protein
MQSKRRVGLVHAMTFEMLAAAIDQARSTDPLRVAYALEGMRLQGSMGEVWMRPDDHQLIEPLYVLSLTQVNGREVKHGVDGEVFAMTGGTYAHDRVRMNLSAVLLPHLRGTPCRVIGPDVKLRVEPGAPAYYPDLFVVCREIEPGASEIDEAKLIIRLIA